jgi:hypothetical protein
MVAADLFSDGHDILFANLLYIGPGNDALGGHLPLSGERYLLRFLTEECRRCPVFSRGQKNLEALLGIFLPEKSVYELGYELNNRPDWIIMPVRGINHNFNKPQGGN